MGIRLYPQTGTTTIQAGTIFVTAKEVTPVQYRVLGVRAELAKMGKRSTCTLIVTYTNESTGGTDRHETFLHLLAQELAEGYYKIIG